MFRSRHVLICVISLYVFYCFAAEVQIHEKAPIENCPICFHNISSYCTWKNSDILNTSCPFVSTKLFSPNGIINCHQVHFSCRAACDERDVVMNIKPRHGANITVRAEKALQFIGWCSGNDTWAIKDVRTNKIYYDVRHARCQKVNIYNGDDGPGTTVVNHSYQTGPYDNKEAVDRHNGLKGIFDLFGILVRGC